MWNNTPVTKILKIKLPIIQAPMAGGITTPKLVANVSNAGGLGTLGAGYMSPEEIKKNIRKIRTLTNKPFAVNLFIPETPYVPKEQLRTMISTLKKSFPAITKKIQPVKPPYMPSFDEQIKVIIAEKVPVFSFTFGVLEEKWIEKLKANKIKIIGTATTASEAALLEFEGVDLVIAQGYEAGGHHGNFMETTGSSLIGTFALIPQLLTHVNIPVIAAGGIMDARGILAAMTLGAEGVQMGTAFITCPESGASSQYKNRLLKLREDHTTLTRAFSGKLARCVKNKFTMQMKIFQHQFLDYPAQNALTKQLRETAEKKDLADYSSFYAGQGACMSQGLTADKLIKQLNKGVTQLIKRIKL